MSEHDLKSLLEAMPRIAEVVNKFKSEEVQKMAFQHFVTSLGFAGNPTDGQHPAASPAKRSRSKNKGKSTRVSESGKENNAQAKKARKRAGSPSLEVLPDLNLRPAKGKSLNDFVSEKSPKTNQDLYVVLVYYLQKNLKQSNIGLNHIYTCLKDLKKKVPAQLASTLTITARRSGRISTSSLQDITVTIHGENFVEHDLPPKNGK